MTPTRRHRTAVRSLLRTASLGMAALGLVAGLAAPAAGQVIPDDQAAALRKSKATQYQAMQNSARNATPLDAKRIEDVFRLRVVDGRIECDGPVIDQNAQPAKPDPAAARPVVRRAGQFRVDVPTLPGPTIVHVSTQVVRQPVPAPGQAAPKLVPANTFSLSSYDLPDPDTLVTMSVQSYPSQFSVSRSTQRVNAHASVSLSQQRSGALGMAGLISFNVSSFGGNAEDQMSFNVQKPDLTSLFRDNPVEVDKYLRPLLSQLGQEQIFAPDPLAAWQVLSDYWKPDAAVARQVADLLPALDDPDYRAREKALASLIALGRPGAAVLLRQDRSGFSAATERMVGRALSAYRQLPEREAVRLRRDVSFLLDCQYIDDADVRRAALMHLLTITRREKLAIDPNGSAADRSAAVRLLRQDLLGEKPVTRPATGPATGPSTAPATRPATAPPARPAIPPAQPR